MSAASRSKGGRGEREVIEIFHAHGWSAARRNFQSGGQGGGDVVDGPPGFHVEVKRRERCEIWLWLAQAEGECRPGDVPLVAFRRSRSRWWAAVPLEDLLALISSSEGASACR